MRPRAGFGVLLSLAVLTPTCLFSQRPPRDSMRMIMLPPPIRIERPMVLAIVPDSLNRVDPRFSAPRSVAESLGFGFDIAIANHLQVVDRRYHAVYSVPSDVQRGYLIIAPGHRPVILWSWVEPDSLRRRITRYRQLAGPLETR